MMVLPNEGLSKGCEYCLVLNLMVLNQTLLVSMRLGDTPVPIPNTMVKTRSADGTILETVWESRWMPLHIFLNENEQSEVRI